MFELLKIKKNKMNFTDFINSESHNIWYNKTPKHVQESVVKMHRFAAFKNIGFKDISDVTALDIHQFCTSLRDDDGLSDNTINHYKAAISICLKYAHDLGLIETLPKIKFAKVRTNRVRYLSNDEAEQLDAFLKSYKDGKYWWMRHMCTIALNTGMRHGEILSITPDNVTVEGDLCTVHLTNTKNGDDRDVVCAGSTFAALMALEFKPGKYYSHRKFYNVWDEARYQIAKGDKEFVFHILRHTAATRMANGLKLPTITVAQQLGHRSLQTTAKYVHQTPETRLEIAKLMGAK